MDNDHTRQQMFNLLTTVHDNKYGHLFREVDRQQIKYVVYLRKSSEENSDKQLKSIGDQFQDIKDLILTPHKITNYDVVEEEHSAKTSDTRTEFRDMLDKIWADEYQGLIAWHPDRLARNMKEAGEIIDMLDRFVIQDLLFATTSFEASATGKMMLGITFALSKQYSEHLSESIMRGYGRRVEEGKYLGKMVHGYKILKEGFLEPDGNNYLVIQQAFRKRIQGQEQLTEIAKWLNKQDYTQCFGRKQVRSRTKFNDKKVSEMFRETVYAGFLMYGKSKPVDLTQLYPFEPMITADEFLNMNKIKNMQSIVGRGTVITQPKDVKLLYGRIICGHCEKNMHVNTGKGKMGKVYVYFRCDNTDCSYKIDNANNPKKYKHQIRANVVTNAAIETLRVAEFDLKKAYTDYVEGAKDALENERIDLLSQERRLRANLQQTKEDLKRAKDIVANKDKADVAKYYEADIKKFVETDIPKFTQELEKVEERKEGLKEAVISEEKFLKLVKKAVDYIGELEDLPQIDEILTKFYSNFVIKDKSVSVITFNQEWYDVLNPVWLGWRDSNPRMLVPETSALPLGDTPMCR
jgi:site-specific DNA recombinase